MRTILLALSLTVALAASALAAEIQGSITDRSGGALEGAVVRLLNVATGQELTATADVSGRFRFTDLRAGLYRVAVSVTGFSDASRTVVINDDAQNLTLDFELQLGAVHEEVTISAARGERDEATIPLRTDTITSDAVREMAPVSTGDAMLASSSVSPVGSGPFQVRPRLRGLDSTRVLVLVDGERLNNARTATDRAGVEVGLVDVGSIEHIEILGGAGSVLYGTDALSGTINIVTNRPRFSDRRLFTAGFDGFYSSNEEGQRGTVVLGLSDRRWAISFRGGAETYDNYRTGANFDESSQQFFDEGRIVQGDTIDDAFGFNFNSFPDPFNAPFTRTSREIPSSGMDGTSINVAGLARLASTHTLEVKYQRRRAEAIGFPDFDEPFFFQSITLPWSRLEKYSASYSVNSLAPWFPRLTITPYYQRQDRLLRNQLPVQFPVPTATVFFPIDVFRLNIESDTRQQVWTPGVDVQGTFQLGARNLLTAGVTAYRDRSEDERTTTTTTTTIGRVSLGQRGPAPTVFASPIVLGTAPPEHPVRVPNATFRDLGLFVQDEWEVTNNLRLTAGIRMDGYQVRTEATPGYEIDAIIEGAQPPIDPGTLPDVDGETIDRTAVTGEAGLVLFGNRPVSVFAHYVRSYRHPNLEELLFAGPATAGSIVPNITVNPEKGHNVDLGTRFRFPYVTGSLSYFNNTYDDFISTEIVATVGSGSSLESISQAVNLARVRIQGVELEANAPFGVGFLNVLPYGSASYTHGTVLEGTSPLSGLSLDDKPQDNITPWRFNGGLRVSDQGERWWSGYSLRAAGQVDRVSPLLSESPFLIAQDLLALDGFSIHRLAAGYDWRAGDQYLGLVLAVDNLTDRFYREQFQFAPARGRSFTVSLSVRGVH
jgi:outer membrane receptor protein involved in Fe transport